MSLNLTELPENLPIPEDDGAADNIKYKRIPKVSLPATNGEQVNLSQISGLIVVYIYPMTGRPDTPLPEGWDDIPGARGCTPQSCQFRDHYTELQSLQAQVFGLSTQPSDYQLEAKTRLHLPFELLSDHELNLKKLLNLPTFQVGQNVLYKRMTLIILNQVIQKVFYPVFPPSENAEEVIKWLNFQKTQQ